MGLLNILVIIMIKFRGVPLDSDDLIYIDDVNFNKPFVYGNYIKYGDNAVIVGDALEVGEDRFWPSWWVPVDSKTVEQFTGLKDVNGKDIYVGDIVRYTRWADHVGIVRYFKPEFELQNIGTNIDIAPTLTMRHELRIIGNVHENPELLEE